MSYGQLPDIRKEIERQLKLEKAEITAIGVPYVAVMGQAVLDKFDAQESELTKLRKRVEVLEKALFDIRQQAIVADGVNVILRSEWVKNAANTALRRSKELGDV